MRTAGTVRIVAALVVAALASAFASGALAVDPGPAHCQPVIFQPLDFDGAYIDVGPCIPPPGGSMSVWIELYSPTTGYYKQYTHTFIDKTTDFIRGSNVGLGPGFYRLTVRTTDQEAGSPMGGMTLRTEATGTVVTKPKPTPRPTAVPTPPPPPPSVFVPRSATPVPVTIPTTGPTPTVAFEGSPMSSADVAPSPDRSSAVFARGTSVPSSDPREASAPVIPSASSSPDARLIAVLGIIGLAGLLLIGFGGWRWHRDPRSQTDDDLAPRDWVRRVARFAAYSVTARNTSPSARP